MVEKRSAVRGLQRFAYDAESRLVERNPIGKVYLKEGEVWKVGETIQPKGATPLKWLKSKSLEYKKVMVAPTKTNMQRWEKPKIAKYFQRRGKLPPGNKCRH